MGSQKIDDFWADLTICKLKYGAKFIYSMSDEVGLEEPPNDWVINIDGTIIRYDFLYIIPFTIIENEEKNELLEYCTKYGKHEICDFILKEYQKQNN